MRLTLYSKVMFTEPDSWTGGAYELAIELEDRSDRNLLAALTELWKHPMLKGCYLSNQVEPEAQERINPAELDLSTNGHYYGVAILPNDKRIVCRSTFVREEDGSDWLYFGKPMGALSRIYPTGAFPFDDGTPVEWRETLDDWLVAVAQRVYQRVSFRLALVGWIIGGDVYADDISEAGVPEQRWYGYLWQEGNNLRWYPPTEKYVIT